MSIVPCLAGIVEAEATVTLPASRNTSAVVEK
jgi:hypothetical protein